jgi:hypothetical protein
MLQQLGKDKVIKPWTIYLWRRGSNMEGASPVITKDGIKQIYCQGWEIEKVPDAKRNEDKHQAWRAKVNVKNMLNNTLNVLNWYGKKVVDSEGNIDPMKLAHLEVQSATKLAKENLRIADLNKKLPKGQKLNEFDLNDVYKIIKFPVKEITEQEAHENGFLGSLIQNKYIK